MQNLTWKAAGRLIRNGSAAAILSISTTATAAPMFMGLGDLAGGAFRSTASAVSADGSTVVGSSIGDSTYNGGHEAIRWTRASGMEGLSKDSFFIENGHASGVSGDGSVVIGASDTIFSDVIPYVWEADRGMEYIIDEYQSGRFNRATAISDDGSTIVGHSDLYYGRTSFRASRDDPTNWLDLSAPPGGQDAVDPYGLSPDGSIIVGSCANPTGAQACRWTETGGAELLGDFEGSSGYGDRALDLSDDGSVIVGWVSGVMGLEAMRWTTDTGLVSIGKPGPGHIFGRESRAVSGDGSVVVGDGQTLFGNEAFIWTEADGLKQLDDVLLGLDLDLDLSGWTLTSASGISADGFTIVGTGINPDGNTEAWIATIPEPSTGLLLALGLVGIAGSRQPRRG